MTAINVFRLPNAAVVMTDGAVVDRTGILRRIKDKSIVFPAAKAVIAMRGQSGFFDELEAGVERLQSRSAEEFMSSIVEIIRDAAAAAESWGLGRQELAFAGWSERENQPYSFGLFTQDHVIGNGAGGTVPVAAFSAFPIPPFFGAPTVQPAIAKSMRLDEMPRDGIDPLRDGLRLMEGQRLSLGDHPYHMVGGFVRMHKISRKGVRSTIVRRWPDEIGKPILPSGS